MSDYRHRTDVVARGISRMLSQYRSDQRVTLARLARARFALRTESGDLSYSRPFSVAPSHEWPSGLTDVISGNNLVVGGSGVSVVTDPTLGIPVIYKAHLSSATIQSSVSITPGTQAMWVLVRSTTPLGCLCEHDHFYGRAFLTAGAAGFFRMSDNWFIGPAADSGSYAMDSWHSIIIRTASSGNTRAQVDGGPIFNLTSASASTGSNWRIAYSLWGQHSSDISFTHLAVWNGIQLTQAEGEEFHARGPVDLT